MVISMISVENLETIIVKNINCSPTFVGNLSKAINTIMDD